MFNDDGSCDDIKHFLSGFVLEKRKTLKYLGLVFTQDLSWTSMVDARISKLKAKTSKLARIFSKVSWSKPKAIKRIYDAVMSPTLFWGLDLTNITAADVTLIRKLRVANDNSLRALLGLPIYFSGALIRDLLDIMDVSTKLTILRTRSYLNLLSRDYKDSALANVIRSPHTSPWEFTAFLETAGTGLAPSLDSITFSRDKILVNKVCELMLPQFTKTAHQRLLRELTSKTDLAECVEKRTLFGTTHLKSSLFGMAKHKRIFTLALLNERIPFFRSTVYAPEHFHVLSQKCPSCGCFATSSHVLIHCPYILPPFPTRTPFFPLWKTIRSTILHSLFIGERSIELDAMFKRWTKWNIIIAGNPCGPWYSIISYPMTFPKFHKDNP